jgi:DNA-binding Lrp family transcriptional regulator
MTMAAVLDDADRAIVNTLQSGFPLTPRPYAEVAEHLGLSEHELIRRIGSLLNRGVLTRFGPMYNAERMGGAFCLCALAVSLDRLDEVMMQVNAHAEVAHNYLREHELNMWFVIATERAEDVERVRQEIEDETGLPVFAFPKLRELFLSFRVQV